MQESIGVDYLTRYQKVIDYIEQHLDQSLTLEQLCQLASLSRFHFHRQFRAIFGCTLAVYIKQQRIKRALHQLLYRKQIRIIDIALSNGYESPEAFTRAFKEMLGVSPSQFRKQGDWTLCHPLIDSFCNGEKIMNESSSQFEVTVIERSSTRLAVLEHRGAAEKIMQSVAKFIDWRIQSKLLPCNAKKFNLIYDDPENTPPEDFRFDICAETRVDIPKNGYGIIEKAIPAGKYALIRHTGSDKNMSSAIHYLYGHWIHQSGYQLREFPLFIERVKIYPDVNESEQVSDIYLPIQ